MANELYNKLLLEALGFNSQDNNQVDNSAHTGQMNVLEAKVNKALDALFEYLTSQGKSLRAWKTRFINAQERKIEQIVLRQLENINLKEDDIYTTKTVIESDKTLTSTYRVKETKGIGRINQILFASDINTYNVYIVIDNNILFNKPYSYFSDNSVYLESISGFIDAGVYYLSIRNIQFKEGFEIQINPVESTTFNEIMIKYTIRDEKPA